MSATTFLRWVGTMDGYKFESLEVIVDNEQRLIVERTIALRPYPALKLFRDAMYAASRISCRPMFGTTQRRSVTTTVRSDRVESFRSALLPRLSTLDQRTPGIRGLEPGFVNGGS